MFDPSDLIRVPRQIDCRAVTFENPSGARGAGGRAANGRKGAPSRRIEPGERVVLADLAGSGTIRHFWMTVPPAPPEEMRALVLEVFYDDLEAPSISVPLLDFFGVAQGRPVSLVSALAAVQEGRGYNSFLPIPFGRRVRVELENAAARATLLYYQIDYTLEPHAPDVGRLHATFHRENPTTLRRDFVVVNGLRGPGRFLGCVVGIRPLDPGSWYGEGELKIFRDGDTDLPTICGTGLEDYVGTAWGMGSHTSLYAGAPLDVRAPDAARHAIPHFVGFYRWHVLDPICFERELSVTLQQIGYDFFLANDAERMARAEAEGREAGTGWTRPGGGLLAHGIVERQDDYCATAFVLCAAAQAVPRVDAVAASADLARKPYEQPSDLERMMRAATA